MRLGAEGWLMGLAVALYLYDSFVLLSSDEAYLVRGWRHWHAAFGSHRVLIAFREPYLPNPFLPHRATIKMRWQFEPPVSPMSGQQLQIPEALGLFGPFVIFSALCLFVILPIGLFGGGGTPVVLAGALAMYANNLMALSLVYINRADFHLQGRKFAGLAFECLSCPPFSLNLVRKLCDHLRTQEDFLLAAARLVAPEEMRRINAECLARIDAQIELEPEASARFKALQRARPRFLTEMQE